MKNTATKTFLFALLVVAFTLFSGCKKACKSLGENVTSGEIKTDVAVYPESGYMTSSMTQSQYLITGSSNYANRFKISFDNGETKQSVNYGQYSILCYPVTTSCFAQFDRNVKIDDANGIVKYTIKVKECGKCTSERTTENYVLIRAVPDTYQVVYDVDIEHID